MGVPAEDLTEWHNDRHLTPNPETPTVNPTANEFLIPNLLVLGLNSLVLSLSAACFARAKYHAWLARSASARARADRNEAKKSAAIAGDHADRLDLPRLLPFTPPKGAASAPKLADLESPA